MPYSLLPEQRYRRRRLAVMNGNDSRPETRASKASRTGRISPTPLMPRDESTPPRTEWPLSRPRSSGYTCHDASPGGTAESFRVRAQPCLRHSIVAALVPRTSRPAERDATSCLRHPSKPNSIGLEACPTAVRARRYSRSAAIGIKKWAASGPPIRLPLLCPIPYGWLGSGGGV